jgi:hypothetical protein
MSSDFEDFISACREAYGVYQQFASRTDEALYRALGQVHKLRSQMQADPALQARFTKLLEQNVADKPTNESLFLVKYAFFPHTLQPGPGHKSDITKASRYAKLINQALDQKVEPADFVAFARNQGIQRTAAGSRRGHFPRAAPHRRRPAARSSSVGAAKLLLGPLLRPLQTSFSKAELAVRLAACLRAAQVQPQKISLTVYVNEERAVLTGVTGQAYLGESLAGTIPVASAEPNSPPAATGQNPPKRQPPPFVERRPRLRPSSSRPTSSSVRGRQRVGNGVVWPAWRAF